MSLTNPSKREINYFFEMNNAYGGEKIKMMVRQSIFEYLKLGTTLNLPKRIFSRNKNYIFCLRRLDRKEAALYFYPVNDWFKTTEIPLTDIISVEDYETRKIEKNKHCFKIITPTKKYMFTCKYQRQKRMLTAAIRFLICEKIVRRSSVNRIPRHKIIRPNDKQIKQIISLVMGAGFFKLLEEEKDTDGTLKIKTNKVESSIEAIKKMSFTNDKNEVIEEMKEVIKYRKNMGVNKEDTKISASSKQKPAVEKRRISVVERPKNKGLVRRMLSVFKRK